MTYWIFVTSQKNWRAIREKNVWGLPKGRKNLIKRLKPGDDAFIYLKQERIGEELLPSRIVGLFEVSSEPYVGRDRIFKDRLYPNRVNLKPKIVLERRYVEFKPLVPKLRFIKGAKKWSAYFRSGTVRIPKEDYELIRLEFDRLAR